MDGISSVHLVFFIYLSVTNVFSYNDGVVNLSNNGPVILGANITFTAEVFDSFGQHPSGTFSYSWQDNADPHHSHYVTGVTNTTMNWTISFPKFTHHYVPKEYEMKVSVSKFIIFYLPYAWQEMKFNITETLNGEITLEQQGLQGNNRFVSIASPVKHTVKLSEPDHDFLTKYATSVLTFWFVNCTYYGFSTDFTFTFNYTEERKYTIDALIVASFDTPPTTTTTTTPTTPATPSTFTYRTPTTHAIEKSTVLSSTTTTTTTQSPHVLFNGSTASANESTTVDSKTFENPTTVSSPKKQTDESDISGLIADGEIHLRKRRAIKEDNWLYNDLINSFDNILSYGCLNSTFVPPSPNKTYGYFRKEIEAKAPISKVVVKGNNWLKFGEVLQLNVTCDGSPRFLHCSKIKVGVYNVTGQENCSAPLERDECNFTLPHYFRQANVYTYIIIIENEVSKVVTPAVIRMYKESVQPQLSVIVVPVTCSLVAIIIIVFGVAYYVQSKNRYTVEVADFDFGQANDMEYKSFYERLRDDLGNIFSRSGDFAGPRRNKYDTMEDSSSR